MFTEKSWSQFTFHFLFINCTSKNSTLFKNNKKALRNCRCLVKAALAVYIFFCKLKFFWYFDYISWTYNWIDYRNLWFAKSDNNSYQGNTGTNFPFHFSSKQDRCFNTVEEEGKKPSQHQNVTPSKLTRGLCSSEVAEIFDLTGKITSVTA